MSNDTTKWPQWLKDAITQDANVEIDEFGRVIWHNGEWRNGVWRNGEWHNGVWHNGVWHNGVWHNGVWRNGEWHNGVWHDGEWRNGVWRNGEWHNGEWHNGEWRNVRGDFFDVLLRVPNEVQGLIDALKAGKVDGSCYEGSCACLCGTIANLKHCNYRNIPNLAPDSSRPIEKFFLAIRRGDTPENNPRCKQAVVWAEEFQVLIAAIRT